TCLTFQRLQLHSKYPKRVGMLDRTAARNHEAFNELVEVIGKVPCLEEKLVRDCAAAEGQTDSTCRSASSIPPGRASWQQGVRSSRDNVASSQRRLARNASRWLRLPASRWSGARIGWTGQLR